LTREETIVSYVVNWRGADGQAGWHPVADLLEAAAHVEHLRNEAGVEATKIFRLEEVGFEFRPYFRVELTEASEPASAPASVESAPITEHATSAGVEDVPPAAEAGPDGSDGGESAPAPDMADAAVATGESYADASDAAAGNGQRRGLFGR
jgi:hypothetical protein